MKGVTRFIVNLLLCSVIVIVCYKIYIKLNSYSEDKATYTKIRSFKKEELNNKNTDYRFWINIPKTNIDYPVMQGLDNNFYLTHDFNKKDSQAGSIFMDYRNKREDFNTIIFGHHMKDNTMLSEVTKFKDRDFFNNNKYIYTKEKNTTHTYEVFAVYVHEGNTDYLVTSVQDDNELLKYIDTIYKNALYKRDINISSKDKIITLSTCSYELNYKSPRTVLHAKLIK